jgi:OOP family OmpA-OmpF porin
MKQVHSNQKRLSPFLFNSLAYLLVGVVMAMGAVIPGVLTGCSSGPSVKVEPLPETANPSQELSRLQMGMKQAKLQQVDVYSAEFYSKADQSLKEAKERLDSGEPNDKVLGEIAKGNAFLARAREVAQLSRTALPDVVAARNQAMKVAAPQFAEKQFNNAEEKLKDAVSEIGSGDLDSARSMQAEIAEAFHEAELSAVLQANLGPAAGMIKTAKDEEAEKWAPKSLMIAEKEFVETRSFITNHRDDLSQTNVQNEIRDRAFRAMTAAEQTVKYTRQTKELNEQPPEETVAQLDQVKKELQEYEERSSEFETALAEQQSTIKKLEGERTLDQKYATARAQFSPKEAEVFRQGDRLVIRLKGLNFDPAASQISSENYALLNKVARVIHEFGHEPGSPNVIVEGNTDSIGNRRENMKLSTQRAEAVKDYLAAIDPELPKSQIEAVGMGDQNPIATNKTTEGREMNRRVDVLIDPKTSA